MVWRLVSSLAGALLVLAVWPVGAARAQPAGSNDRVGDRAGVTAELILLDAAHLATLRARTRNGEPELDPVLAALEQDARRALEMSPVSVTDKAVTPPSGDKHDYMSQAPYWWPDPDKPHGLPYVRRDGERNPDIGRITDRDNLGRLSNAVATLGLAYFFTGREAYASRAATLVRVWFLEPATRMNPHLRFGQGIPGITEGRGIGIIETRLLVDLLDGVLLIAESGAWSRADDAGLQAWMRSYLTWLLESPHGQEEARNGNNHETWYDVQVVSLALYTGQRNVARTALEGSRDRIGRHVEPDGRQPRELERTRSWDYSIFNLTAFFHLAALGERLGIDLWNHRMPDGRSLRAALDFLVSHARGSRPWPYSQITAFRPGELHALLRRAASGWNDPAYRALAAEVGGGSARLDIVLP